MKFLLALIVLMTSTVSFAGMKFICKETPQRSYGSKKTMILTQVGNESVREGVKYNFTLEVYEPNKSTPMLSERVVVETEDVMFGFSNKAKRISGMIYLDELDQSHLTIGNKEFQFDCN